MKILILGANGQLARNTTRALLRDTDAELTLYLRRASRLKNPDPARATIVEGDVLDAKALKRAMADHDVVYANLAGDLKRQTEHIVDAMHTSEMKRLIFITQDGEVAYQVAQKGDPFQGHEVSLNSLSALIVKLALNPAMAVRRSLGVSRG